VPRPRKRHVQLSFPHRGGKRKGAGRPKQGHYASEPHRTRPKLTGREPVLITARVTRQTANLRRMTVYRAVRRALSTILMHHGFRVIHVSIQRAHLHLIVEAESQQKLSRGMQGLLISAARRINACTRSCGTVFPDRYHERIIDSPRQCRNALAYVLNNYRRHGEDRGRSWLVDPFSSGINFGGWRELAGSNQLFAPPRWYERLPTSTPQTWLLKIGWTKHPLIAVREIPGPPRAIG
jgi:REP element-mobilizing transposase RayT